MKKILLIFILLLSSLICFAQMLNNNDSCYAVTKKDTIWKTSCPSIQIQPSFPGGERELFTYLGKNTTYPKQAQQLKLQGRVFITFVIDKNGEVIDVDLYKGINIPTSVNGKKVKRKDKKKYIEAVKQINEESIRVVRAMPKWSPGMQDDKHVKVRYILPLNFKIQ